MTDDKKRGIGQNFNDLIVFQNEFQKDLNEHARIRDILLVLYCLIVPFFSQNYFIVSVIYGVVGLFYLRITIDFRKECYIYQEDTKTYGKIINEHRKFFINNDIR